MTGPEPAPPRTAAATAEWRRARAWLIAGVIAVVLSVVSTALVIADAKTVARAVDGLFSPDEDVAVHFPLLRTEVSTGSAELEYVGGTSGSRTYSEGGSATGTHSGPQRIEGRSDFGLHLLGDLDVPDQRLSCTLILDGVTLSHETGTGRVTCLASIP